jgi:23S rRNA (adenine2030-N6)-methyltransferase
LARFATGTYAIWYPQLHRREAAQLPGQLRRIASGDWLNVSLTVMRPRPDGFGLHGSGMFIVNPPWQLHSALSTVMPTLVGLLGVDDGADFDLQSRQS